MSDPGEITRVLLNWDADRQLALDKLTPVVYSELHRIAASYLRRERTDHTLQPTALIHEAYLRLIDQNSSAWRDRAHFFGVAAQIMRQVLVDFARKHRAAKRGGGQKLSLDAAPAITVDHAAEFLHVHEALEKLKEVDARKAQVIELRYFGGLSREEVAEALNLTLPTVKRDLSIGEAWLRRALDA